MGKKRENSGETDTVIDSPPGSAHKKHKKHKKHKHKHKRGTEDEDEGEINVTDEVDSKPAIKLKIKIGGQTLGTKSVGKQATLDKEEKPDAGGDAGSSSTTWEGSGEPLNKSKKDGEDTSDEEREWLDALEKGTLDDSGMLKKSKDPALMTARQRALLHGNCETEMLELPSGYKSSEMTEEQLQRRQQRAKKRREQAQEKREKDKKLTLDRLLKKQESRAKSQRTKPGKKSHVPGYRYLNTASSITISVPESFQFPFSAQAPVEPRPVQKCGVAGCGNNKKYSCSKTGIPLCSLACYQKNLQAVAPVPVM